MFTPIHDSTFQFLRYQVEIPELHDFTFCIWVKSSNFSNPHPLFSYSKDETERLLRLWLEPPLPGRRAHVKFEVLKQDVMSAPIDIALEHWYHFCQSWSNTAGQWALYINGKLAATGEDWQTTGLVIPGGGDVVVGQEYTDFDKGLDDGIEGEVFGFNLLTSEPTSSHGSRGVSSLPAYDNALVLPRNHYVINSAEESSWLSPIPRQQSRVTLRVLSSDKKLIRWPEETKRSEKVLRGDPGTSRVRWPSDHRNSRRAPPVRNRETRDASVVANPGLELVRKSYRQCVEMRGSPVDQSRLLIAWASTPVRVFGGAVIKSAKPVCGDF
ncbi:hypothetical protein B7P43_G02274 [Cryptotermes secundus]|uniref:Pentraxin (PTX) domain-containing protein n=1 Tax=Cryptotermes secundus TaxID=105785 RepID=A0A2J7QG79_9NEOP|nr:hypothetical protein B7P43_G02274 [Cryptotermes secundus]